MGGFFGKDEQPHDPFLSGSWGSIEDVLGRVEGPNVVPPPETTGSASRGPVGADAGPASAPASARSSSPERCESNKLSGTAATGATNRFLMAEGVLIGPHLFPLEVPHFVRRIGSSKPFLYLFVPSTGSSFARSSIWARNVTTQQVLVVQLAKEGRCEVKLPDKVLPPGEILWLAHFTECDPHDRDSLPYLRYGYYQRYDPTQLSLKVFPGNRVPGDEPEEWIVYIRDDVQMAAHRICWFLEFEQVSSFTPCTPASPQGLSVDTFYNATDFPPFRKIPDEDDTEYEHYLASHNCIVHILRHWCLLGDIKDVSMSVRPRITAKDREGSVFRLHMHVKDHWSTLRLEDMKVGHTLAVMCPEVHGFMDGTAGIRQENSDTVYIFRTDLSRLMAEGVRITAGMRCFQCGDTTTNKCLRCGVAYYCGRECQHKHWHAVHKGLCSQMSVLQNLVQLDFSRRPSGDLEDFCTLARPKVPSSNAGKRSHPACHLPRPCVCGFQDGELANSDDCPAPGLANHLDFPPAWCLPQIDSVGEQFYYDDSGAPSRHWALVAEVRTVSTVELKAVTRFGEKLRVMSDDPWNTSLVRGGNCIICFYATLSVDGRANDGEAVVSTKQKHVLHFQTSFGLEVLLNAHATIIQTLPNHLRQVVPIMPIARTDVQGLEDLPILQRSLLQRLVFLQMDGSLRQREGPDGCLGSLWDEGHLLGSARRMSGTRIGGISATAAECDAAGPDVMPDSAAPAGRASEPLDDARTDLMVLLARHPAGLAGAQLPHAYEEHFGRRLEPKALGCKSWRRLLETCPDLEITGEAGKDMFVQLKVRSPLSTPEPPTATPVPVALPLAPAGPAGRAGEPLEDARADLRTLLAEHPAGLAGAKLPRAYEELFGRRLEPKALGCKSWRRLLETCPDLEIMEEAGTDMFVQLKAKSACSTSEVPTASSVGVALPMAPARPAGRAGGALEDARADLRVLLAGHPVGIAGAQLPRAYEEYFGRHMEPKALGCKSWRRLLETCPDIEITGEAGKDMFVQLRARSSRGTPEAPTASPVTVALPLAPVAIPRLGSARMRPGSIFFTHDSVSNKFKDGRLVRETLRQLQVHEIEPSVIPAIQVCWHAALGYDSRFWTYTGNRRLWVFKQLEEDGLVGEIEVVVVDKTVPKIRMTTKNGGVSVRVRGDPAGDT